jgi:transcriptional regulator with XRE-family HTH domain
MIIVGIAEGLYGLGLWLTEYISLDIVRDVNEVLLLRRRAGVTQSRLAELAGTSQPTIAAYESGSKVPNLRTLRKLARALGLEARVQFVPALTREDRRSLALHEAIAQRLIEDPVAVTERARKTLSLMIEKHPGAAPLLTEWDAILRRPVSEVADLLLDPRPRARDLRQVTPFAGILSTAERTEVYKRFAASEGMTP